ncbi:MAG: hypothetical protein Q7W16_05315 [Coriobacteriia bacterium]|nr:hypothetical protein [Coriobacteriia bacterium]
MARAGYCSACGQNVYLGADGSCVNGHAAEYVSNSYAVPDGAPATVPPVAAPYTTPVTAAAPKKKRTGLIIALVIVGLLLLCGCGVGVFVFIAASSSDSSSSTSEPVATATEKAKLTTALSFVKSMAKGDAELMKSVMPAETLSAIPDEFWTAFVESTAASASSVYGKETWKGATLTIDAQSNQGSGTVTLKISATDPDSIDLQTVRADKSTTDSVMKLGQEGGAWKVLSFSSGAETIPFDAAGLQAFIDSNQ